MAQNRAAQDLANLTQATESARLQAAREAEILNERGQEGARVASSGKDGTADFAAPEALATGVVGTILFGPVGGVLLGAAQGWLGKQERQNALDAQAERNEALGDAENVLRGQFDTLLNTAANSNDVEQLLTLRTQQEAAFKLMRSGDDVNQALGMEMLQAVQDQANAYAVTQEQQIIDHQTRQEDARRTLSDTQYNRYNDLLGDFDAQQANYQASIEKGNEILRLIEGGSPFDLNAALIGMAKLNDPTSAAMEGEVNAWRNIGNLVDRSQKYIGLLSDGKPLNADQAKDLQRTVTTIIDARKQLASSRQTMFQDRLATAFEVDSPDQVPERFMKNFRMVQDLPAVRAMDIPWQTMTDEGGMKKAGEDLDAALDTSIHEAEELYTAALDKGEAAMDWWEDYLEKSKVRHDERVLTNPGLWQPGGFFGRDLTEEEKQMRDEILQQGMTAQ